MTKNPKKKQVKDSGEALNINSGGGSYIGGDVSINGGDFVGRDKVVISGDRAVAIRGNVSGGTIITGNGNVITGGIEGHIDWAKDVLKAIEENTSLNRQDKQDLKIDINEIQSEIEKGEKANEDFLSRRLRNIKRIAPDILDVIISTFLNPINGLGTIARKIAQKMQSDSQSEI